MHETEAGDSDGDLERIFLSRGELHSGFYMLSEAALSRNQRRFPAIYSAANLYERTGRCKPFIMFLESMLMLCRVDAQGRDNEYYNNGLVLSIVSGCLIRHIPSHSKLFMPFLAVPLTLLAMSVGSVSVALAVADLKPAVPGRIALSTLTRYGVWCLDSGGMRQH